MFYAAIAHGLHMEVPLWHLAIVVPLSFVVLMLPISVNGLGLREATFVLYLTRLGVPAASATALSLTSYGLIADAIFDLRAFAHLSLHPASDGLTI